MKRKQRIFFFFAKRVNDPRLYPLSRYRTQHSKGDFKVV